jgi:hypothetical protein
MKATYISYMQAITMCHPLGGGLNSCKNYGILIVVESRAWNRDVKEPLRVRIVCNTKQLPIVSVAL